MPKEMERSLAAQARKDGLKGKTAKRYVYGTMERLGELKPRRRKKRIK